MLNNSIRAIHLPLVIMSLAFVPAPARFALAAVLVLELNILVLAAAVLKMLKIWTLLSDFKTLLILATLVAIVTVYSSIVGAWSPETQLQLSFVMYLQAASSFIISTTFGRTEAETEEEEEGEDRWDSLKKSAAFSVIILVLFAIREIAGYGTITYPSFGGIKECVIMKSGVRALTLLATIPGALLCTAVLVALSILFKRGIGIFYRAGGKDD